ncbi:hypothetical protein NYZ34_20125, partial [Acinetobacter baumannii]|nr:hypothetical protein [Acinetobacter baumannii]
MFRDPGFSGIQRHRRSWQSFDVRLSGTAASLAAMVSACGRRAQAGLSSGGGDGRLAQGGESGTLLGSP